MYNLENIVFTTKPLDGFWWNLVGMKYPLPRACVSAFY